jgi:magnesium-transporting ATPase (P-type)
MATNRLRVVVFAIRQFNQFENKPDYETSSSQDRSLDLDDRNLKLVGMVGLELNFKDGIQEALCDMKDARIATRVVTIDQRETVLSLMKSDLIDFDGEFVVMPGKELTHFFLNQKDSEEDKIKAKKIVENLRILYESTPDDSTNLVKFLKDQGRTVMASGRLVHDKNLFAESDIKIALGKMG